MWLIKELNLAQMTFPFPLNVVVALQYKWFSQGLIHSPIDSSPFSFDSFDRTFLISRKKKTREMRCCTPTDVVNETISQFTNHKYGWYRCCGSNFSLVRKF